MSEIPLYATAHYVREALRTNVGMNATFGVADILKIIPNASWGTVSAALSDLNPSCIVVIGREGNRAIYRKIADPPVVAPRKKPRSPDPVPGPVQHDMPLLPPPSEPAVDIEALRQAVREMAALLGIAFDIKSVSAADFWADAARRTAAAPTP